MNGTIDTLDFARNLEKAGLQKEVADGVAREVGHFVAARATHPDALERMEKTASTKADIELLRAEFAAAQKNQRWINGILIALVVGLYWKMFDLSADIADLNAAAASLTVAVADLKTAVADIAARLP
jgi:hypothetical protein